MANSFNSYQNVLKFEGKAEQLIKTMLPLEIAAYNATTTPGYELPTYFNVAVGSPIDGETYFQSDGKPFVNFFSTGERFAPSSITNCRDEQASYSIICYIPDSPRASRTSIPLVKVMARLVADLLEKYLIDSPGDDDGICSRINWVSQRAGVSNKTGAASELVLEVTLRSVSEYEPIKMTPYFSTFSTVVPPVFQQNWIPEIQVDLDAEPTQTAYTLQNLTYTVTSVSLLELTYAGTGNLLTSGYCWLPSPLISQQLIVAGAAQAQTLPFNLTSWDTNYFSTLTPGDEAVLRIVVWNETTAESSMFTITLIKA
jgi:hypothetical protein